MVRTIYAEADGVALPEPDPANKQHNTYAWMTVHKFTPDRPVTYPFKDINSLQIILEAERQVAAIPPECRRKRAAHGSFWPGARESHPG